MAKEEKTKKIDFHSFKNKGEAVKAAMAEISSKHGDEALMLFGETGIKEIPVVSTGSLNLDIALGAGGYPFGRIIEIYGPEGSGKTTLALNAIAQVQKMGGNAAFIDAEHALDPKWATTNGVDMDALYISQPDHGEQALDICETLVGSGGFQIVVVDSVAALTPKAEIDGDMGDFHVGTQARLMSQALRKLTAIVSKTNTILIFINQIRMKIGVMFGNPETTTGGNGLKFYASQRLDVRRISTLKTGGDKDGTPYGFRIRVKVVKNKVAPPFREVEFDVLFDKGFNRAEEVVENAVTLKLVDKAGAWYSYNGEKIGQGIDKVAAYLVEHPEVAKSIEASVKKHYNLK